ncbi:MAG: hypothetical protein M5R36_24090 [Deltaproteobacteria bacterium]|nr:hypothetical protein [Deltaproteobacteria bacterium]
MEQFIGVKAYAKVNLRLEVLARRSDGYHDLQMVNACLDLADDLVLERTDNGIRLVVEGADLPVDADNLAYRAARAFLDAAGEGGGVVIKIGKKIPVAAGLGGGSGDAAAVLRGMNELFGAGLDDARLADLGLKNRRGRTVLFARDTERGARRRRNRAPVRHHRRSPRRPFESRFSGKHGGGVPHGLRVRHSPGPLLPFPARSRERPPRPGFCATISKR